MNAPSCLSDAALAAELRRLARCAVWLRDGGRCAFVATDGHRCDARGFLEFHHRTPYAVGGKPTVGNIELRCRSHNAHEAELYFGPRSHPDVVRETIMAYGRPHLELVPGQVRAGAAAHGRRDNPARGAQERTDPASARLH